MGLRESKVLAQLTTLPWLYSNEMVRHVCTETPHTRRCLGNLHYARCSTVGADFTVKVMVKELKLYLRSSLHTLDFMVEDVSVHIALVRVSQASTKTHWVREKCPIGIWFGTGESRRTQHHQKTKKNK